jgi:hypothetical protein
MEWGRPALADLGTDGDLFDQIDSFAVVELLLLTETEVETALGRYVPLADEKVLDASQSPLLRLSSWIEYVAAAMDHG